jgi:hypothetical protein
MGLIRLESDHCVFVSRAEGHMKGVIVQVYVDDLLTARLNRAAIALVKQGLQSYFNIKDMGPVQFFLGVRVVRDRLNRIIRLYKNADITRVLERFGLSECRPTKTPILIGRNLQPADANLSHDDSLTKQYQKLVRLAMYAMIQTLPDIAYAVGMLSRFCHE